MNNDEGREEWEREHDFPLWFEYTMRGIRRELNKVEDEVKRRTRKDG